MAKLSKDRSVGNIHPREALWVDGVIGALNAEAVTDCDGCSVVSLDLRGTLSLTLEVSGTIDGTNWTPIPMRPVNVAAVKYVATVVATAGGVWVGLCGSYRMVRARCTAYTSGSAVTTLSANSSVQALEMLAANITTDTGTAVGASGAAVTLTMASPGAGLRHYLTYLSINRFAAALLTPAAAPVTVTTTNIPGTLAFSIPAEAAAQGTLDRWREDFAYPIATSAQAAATTIVCPATTGVIWRVTAGYYVAP